MGKRKRSVIGQKHSGRHPEPESSRRKINKRSEPTVAEKRSTDEIEPESARRGSKRKKPISNPANSNQELDPDPEPTPALPSDGRNIITSQHGSITTEFFRISRIPRTITALEVETWLSDAIFPTSSLSKAQEILDKNMCKLRSLAPFDSRYSQAIISTETMFLDAGIQTIVGPHGHELSVDKNFYGLTVLSPNSRTDSPGEIVADIILVHGLGGHAVGSWKPSKSSRFWPLDFLPEDVENVRIMTYGYNTDLDLKMGGKGKEHHGKKTLSSISKSMLEDIHGMRDDEDCQKRPIIFMGHSLGGILIKNALVLASKNQKFEPWGDIFQSCQSLIFFGVPNLGMSFDDLARMVEGGESERLVRDLFVDEDHDTGALLDNLNKDFVSCMQDQSVDILCHYETLGSKPITDENLENIRRWPIIVNQQSAAYTGLVVQSYNIQELAGDHRSMVKFPDATNDGYRRLSRRIKLIVRAIESESVEAERKRQEERLIKRQELSTDDQNCIRSFAFKEMSYRRKDVDHAHAGTCRWILDHEVFKTWSSDDCGLLWVKGKPGSGKSTLMGFLYEHLHQSGAPNEFLKLDFFFHGRGTVLQRNMAGMLRSLICQLYTEIPTSRSIILSAYKDKLVYGEAWSWHTKELQELFFTALMTTAPEVKLVIFIDALDEAGEESAGELATYFHKLNDKYARPDSITKIKICISSRHYPIKADLCGLEIWVENHNNDDIATYVRERFHPTIASKQEIYRLADLEKIQQTLIRRASGVFQWPRVVLPLVIRRLGAGASLKAIQKMVDQVPEDLGNVYSYIILNVIDRGDLESSLLLMQWVLFGERPLSLTELRFAFAADEVFIHSKKISATDSTDFITSDALMEIRVTSLSGGLAEIIRYGDRTSLQFIHQSVKDFLLSDGLALLLQTRNHAPDFRSSPKPEAPSSQDIIGTSHDRLCKSCVNYLSFEEVLQMDSTASEEWKTSNTLPNRVQIRNRRRLGEEMKNRLPFIDYASEYWFVHAETAESHGSFQIHLLKDFEHPSNQTFQGCINFHQYLEKNMRSPSYLDNDSTLLHLASGANLLSVARTLLKNGADGEEKDANGNRPLHFAASRGFKDMVALFLKHGVKIEAKNNDGNTALTLAVGNGFDEIAGLLLSSRSKVNSGTDLWNDALLEATKSGSVFLLNLLLDEEVDVNAPGDDHVSALYTASSIGTDSIVKLLLNSGADVNTQGDDHTYALHGASAAGNYSTVKLLLDRGADVNIQGGYYGCALQAAASHRHLLTVKLLLDRGADVNVESGYFGYALHGASANGNEPIVKLLLDRGADVNAQGGSYGYALQAASAAGNESTVKLLLDRGADVNAQGGHYGCALQAAVPNTGNESIFKLLLDRGADVNIQGGYYGSALQAASAAKNDSTVKLLLDRGADVNAQGGQYSALYTASSVGNESTVKLLLDKGADANATGNNHTYALHGASAAGNDSIVKLLLDKGADVNIQGGYYGCALQAAASTRHWSTVKLLLDSGADVNAQGGSNGHALHGAVTNNGDGLIVELLLDRGADVNAESGYYGFALHGASATGNDSTVKLLLDRGADVNAEGGYFCYALLAASAAGHESTVKLLLDRGADVNAQVSKKDSGFFTPLYTASHDGDIDIIKHLLEKGAAVNARDNKGRNALCAASAGGFRHAVQLLLENGANINVPGEGNAMQAALNRGNEDIAQLLLEHGAKPLEELNESSDIENDPVVER